ncbi:uncharacterized protein BO88DRAFT_207177 [Aspergillus vadensis CBS 113365]|uniref:Uncharacterized protein n=1 Tax=Aspergillus vadensis (strain CBS 113365 / IMI 142717 / IBT 24658) TaxID=1448311 RepID=A0A319BHQ5_ASPVC|nr:hypothetical protein BO88DRAFT_207177 [Aspergillus vadensis CBS 113365]PYH72167.1 hypothetical protein BO88DRAFT_207177 [Aspergillus vadensis CBS 113365]
MQREARSKQADEQASQQASITYNRFLTHEMKNERPMPIAKDKGKTKETPQTTAPRIPRRTTPANRFRPKFHRPPLSRPRDTVALPTPLARRLAADILTVYVVARASFEPPARSIPGKRG